MTEDPSGHGWADFDGDQCTVGACVGHVLRPIRIAMLRARRSIRALCGHHVRLSARSPTRSRVTATLVGECVVTAPNREVRWSSCHSTGGSTRARWSSERVVRLGEAARRVGGNASEEAVQRCPFPSCPSGESIRAAIAVAKTFTDPDGPHLRRAPFDTPAALGASRDFLRRCGTGACARGRRDGSLALRLRPCWPRYGAVTARGGAPRGYDPVLRCSFWHVRCEWA